MDSRCRRRSRRPVFTATLEIERNLGTLLAFTRWIDAGKSSSVTPRKEARSARTVLPSETASSKTSGRSWPRGKPLEVPREVRAVEAHLECSRPRSDELLERSPEVAPLEDEPVLGVRPIDRMPEHDEELRRWKHIPDPIGAHGVVQVLGEISPIAPYLAASSGGQKNPSYQSGPCSKWRSKNRTSFRRVGRYTCGCPSKSVWSQVVPARGTPIPTNVGSVIERHLGPGSVRTPALGWRPCRAQRRAGRGIDPRVRAGAPRPR